jgi:hypothetical protein
MKIQQLVFSCMILMVVVMSSLVNVSAADETWKRPFLPDSHTVVLYHFDEGVGNEAHDALGDKALTLRANKQVIWQPHQGI